MDVEAITSRLARRYGDAIAPWCADVPRRAAEMAGRWGLRLGAPFEAGASSVAIACTTAGGAQAVLKLGPDPAVLAEQTAVLRWWAPTGRAPAVLAAAPDAVLLDAIVPGTAAEELAVAPSPHAWAALVRALHGQPGAPPVEVRPLGERCGEFFVRIGRRLDEPAVAAHVDRDLWDLSWRRCRELAATAPARVVLHGDLHLGNVLDGGPGRGLVAIDPKVTLGDPCFDVVDYVLDGAGRDGVEERCASTADACGLDRRRLRAWCAAVAPVVAVARIGRDDVVAELLALSR